MTVAAPVITTNTTTYQAQSAMKVCTSGEITGTFSELESNSYTTTGADGSTITVNGRCRAYGGNYKPVGLMQKYSAESTSQTDAIRYSIFGYMQDPNGDTANEQLDGGVMRAKMKSVGPFKANPGTVPSANTAAEWDASTGVFATNPNATDATASSVSNSGVANYLNKFGFVSTSAYTSTTRAAYKRYDSVSELYYMATRYYRNLGNLTSHTTTATAITNGTATKDGFPVITTWDDPVAYTCSTNYIVGMGDTHTWNDGNLPGSTINGGFEVADSQVTADGAVSVKTSTDWIGNLEHLAGYTGAGVVGGTTANNSYDIVQTAALGSTQANVATTCCNGNTYYMAGLAYDAHIRDQRPDITVKSQPITVSTFWLDVMESEVGPTSATGYYEKNQFWMTAKYGGFNKSDASFGTSGYPTATQGTPATYPASVQNTALPVTSWNTAGYVDDHNNYAPDQYFQAGKPSKMTSGLNSAFSKIASSNPAGTSAALGLGSSTFSGSGDLNYLSSFGSDWSGSVAAEKLTATLTGGVVTTTATAQWSAGSWLPPNTGTGILTYDTRIIASSTAVGAGHGVKFRSGTGGISTTQQATLGASATQQKGVLNYLRGDTCNEPAAGSAFPTASATICKGIYGTTATSLGFRARPTSVLGDITDSQPVTLYGAPEKPYADAPLNPDYSTFKSDNASRKAVLYVGANDGMLHAFDATTGSTGGKELFAYVPSSLFTANTDSSGNAVGLSSLITSPLKHHFMVDAQPLVTDVDFARTNLATTDATWPTVTSDWRTIVVSGLGKGGGTAGGTAPYTVGGGYFALDVTDPSSISSEGVMAGKVLWETDPSVLVHMGYSYGLPHIIKTKKYGWTLVLTSGYGNDDGKGYFYLVNPKDGSLYERIDTGAGSTTSPAGLAQPNVAWIPNQADFTADALYAGDLLGNVWRVDLSTTGTLSATRFATLASGDSTQLNGSTAQPVMTSPVVAADPSTGTRYVFVGTGKLLDDTDLVNPQTETFYAFVDGTSTAIDTSSSFPITRTNLVSNDPASGVTLTSTQRGFYIDLAAAATNGAGTQASAERVNVQTQASGGTVLFAANLFGQNVCVKGSSRIFALNYDTSVQPLGETLLQSSATPSTLTAYLSYSTGVVTNLTLASVSSPLSTSSTGSGMMAMWGLDTTAGGANQTAQSTVGGDILSHGSAFIQRINWRVVPQSQPQ